MNYHKLVRDRIPAIKERNGQVPVVRILGDAEYAYYLEQKLDEEVSEFHKDKNVEELADILEVVYALAENMGHTKEELLEACQKKHDERGGFRDRIFLISNDG